MAFGLKEWKAKVAAGLVGWKGRLDARSSSVYAALAAAALWPVVTAQGADAIGAGMALGGVLGNVGTNLVANVIEKWKEENELARDLAQEVIKQPELRAELDEVLLAVEAIPAAFESLQDTDRKILVAELRRELAGFKSLARLGKHLEAYDRAVVVSGKVTDSIVSTGDGATITVTQHYHNNEERAKAQEAEQHYLTRLFNHCNVLPLAAMGGEETTGDEVGLDRVYVELETMTRVPDSLTPSEASSRSGQREDMYLGAMEVVTAQKRVVFLGGPGSGKSTFVCQLAAWLAHARLGKRPALPGWEDMPVPILVLLRDLAPALTTADLDTLSDNEQNSRLVAAVEAEWVRRLEEYKAVAFRREIDKALEEGRALLIFDGLDEIAEPLRPRVRCAVSAIINAFSRDNRIIVTCRTRSYTEKAALPGFAAHTLAPFDEERIRRFVAGWYNAQMAMGRFDKNIAEEKTRDLQRAALAKELHELSSNPLLLTTMAIIHQREVGLPRERVRLYQKAVDVLLDGWQKRKGRLVSENLAAVLQDEKKLRAILEELAYRIHSQQAKGERDRAFSRGELLALLENPEYLGTALLVTEFLDYIDQRAGILVGHGGGEDRSYPQTYSFPHRTFQEYLAGSRMISGREAKREYWQRVEEGDYWTLAAQLGAEELWYNNSAGGTLLLDLAYDLARPTRPSSEGEWRAALWAGEMAVVMGTAAIVKDAEKPGSDSGFLPRLLPRLVDILQGKALGPIERAAAGRIIAKLGDPRVEVLNPEAMEFCEIPAGPFTMGSKPDPADYKDDPADYDDEKPQHVFTVPYAFRMARYPVTNAQYQAFVTAGGYETSRFWPEAEEAGVWRNGAVKGELDDSSRHGPVDYGVSFNLANHPVVGVTWYEAMAFTRWLTEILRKAEKIGADQEIRLPTEAEWEKAARGDQDARIFPWGNKSDSNRANYSETEIGTTSAVGCFADGASPYGCLDMAGNVWEWCLTKWRDNYQEYATRVDNDLTGEDGRVSRGGSFFHYDRSVRCAARSCSDPGNRDWPIGIRVVASPISL